MPVTEITLARQEFCGSKWQTESLAVAQSLGKFLKMNSENRRNESNIPKIFVKTCQTPSFVLNQKLQLNVHLNNQTLIGTCADTK